MTLTFRHMTEADIPIANEIIRVAYNLSVDSTPRLQRYLSLPDRDWLLAVHDGVVVGIGGATHFGAFSYIGLMGVLPTMQGRGIGWALMEKLLDRVHTRRIPAVLLDASDAGIKLYKQLGFIEDDRAVQLQQTGSLLSSPPPLHPHIRVAPMQKEDIPALVVFDRLRSGVERLAVLASFLKEYPERAFVARNPQGKVSGFLIAQPRMLGPWMAETVEVAEQLLLRTWTLAFEHNTRQVITPACNRDAERLLLRYGFAQQRALTHMRLGNSIALRDRTKIYGQASYALG